MRITIAERLRPFSHRPGTSFVLPGSLLSLEIFPAMIRVKDLTGSLASHVAEIAFDIAGPVDNFTALQDLENGSVRVWGTNSQGYFRYTLKALENTSGMIFSLEKAPVKGILVECTGEWNNALQMHAGEKVVLAETLFPVENEVPFFLTTSERLSLGSHKLQDWELVKRRLSFTEIFPIWHRLAQMVPKMPNQELTGTALLLDECRQAIEAKAPEKILTKFRDLFLAGFDSILSPRLMDSDFQGIKHQGYNLAIKEGSKTSPLVLLTHGAELIRSLFLREGAEVIHVLPSLPPEFHCGRFLDLKCVKNGTLSMEWTKKSLRCLTYSALEEQTLAFTFSNHEKKCRLRHSNKDKGVAYIPGTPLDIVANQPYWFDNFER